MRMTVFTIFTLMIMAFIALFSAIWPIAWLGISIVGGLIVLISLACSLVRIEADPPHKAVLVFWGNRQSDEVLEEGIRFLPFARITKIIYDYIPVKVVKINQDLKNQVVRTPDLVEVGIEISITWTPGNKVAGATQEEIAESFIVFLNSGEEEGVKGILEDIVRDRIRTWAFSEIEGPSNWREATGAKEAAVAVLLKAILGEALEPISSDIPTTALLRYFAVPQQPPLVFEERDYGKGWKKLRHKLSSEKSPEEIEALKYQIKQRRQIIQAAQQGNGHFYKPSLGITINRFTINEVVLLGEAAKTAELKVKEQHEKDAEEVEIENVSQRAQRLMEELGISAEEAVEIVQTERGKVGKTIDQKKINISPETLAAVERFFGIFKK